MMRRRVKITGIGPVTPAGVGREAFWKGIVQPVSYVRPFSGLGKQLGPLVAAHMGDFDVRTYIDVARFPRGSSRQTSFAVAGAVLALADAGIGLEEVRQYRSAIITGSSVLDFGGVISSIDSVSKLGAKGAKPRTIFTVNSSSVCGAINEVLGTSAQAMGVQSSCCSGLDAIGFAVQMVASGEVQLAICGGVEAPLHRFPLLELRAAELTPPTDEMPERLDRPFDLWRTTGVVSEGAAMFIVEPDDSPRQGYSWITGYAFASDPAGDLCGGMLESGRLAMAEARIRPSELDTINAWGPGHKLVDLGEARAMRKIFGQLLEGIPAVSIKGALGTPLGAAPAIQVAVAALAQKFGQIPPTVNWDYPDPSCPLNLSNRSRLIPHRRTLVNAHGLGGANSSMILEKW
jgi:3-oxoacyl-(acyl-carrier-protein) synthase